MTPPIYDPDSPLSSSELDPLSIGEELIPIRIPKAAGQTTLDFAGALNPPLSLHEDLKEGCGGQLWPAGMVLAKYILKDLDLIRGKVVIELGAGGGLVGLALAMALAQSKDTATVSPILITDLPILLPLQETNIKLNGLDETSIISSELSWGSSLPQSMPVQYRTPDVILAADCVYFEPAFPLLLETLENLMSVSPAESREINDTTTPLRDPVCYFCMKKRRKADMRFIVALKKKFAVEDIDAREEIIEEGGGIFLYAVRRKKRS